MRIIDLPDYPLEVNRLLDEARTEDVLVRLADGSEFLLMAVDEFDQEIAKSRNNPRLMALLDQRAAAQSTIGMNEVKRRLNP